MKREWKPGDVALVEAGCWANRKVALRLAEGWAHTNGVNVDGDGVVSPVRPLVVIDPEDREQVERLMSSLKSQDQAPEAADIMQAALREFANPTPPKPEEPTGLGAVVEATFATEEIRDGRRTVWARGEDGQWQCLTDGRIHASAPWPFLSDVRVLSEGVQA